MALAEKDLFSMTNYEYGEAYFGSYRGMLFRVARQPLENVHFTPPDKRGEATLHVTIWPEPDSYRSAPKEARTERDFPVTEEGLQEIVAYLNEYHDAHRNLWPKQGNNQEDDNGRQAL